MSTILVTGGAGFLGAHLVALLLGQGHRVIAIDSLWTGSAESIAKLSSQVGFTFIQHDVSKPFPPEVQHVDQIYHLACPASPKRFPENPLGILDTCFAGTRNVLELGLRCNARVLLASTSEVYGDPLICPQPETYWGNVNSFGPRSCYDEGKRVAEALAYAYRKQHGVEIRIARIFNAYGPGIRPDDGRVVPNFVTAAITGRDIEIAGDGTASRCFQYVSDCVEGLNVLMNSSCESPVNIGCEDETSIGQLAEIIRDLVSRKLGRQTVKVKLTGKREDDPFRRQPDISLAREKLHWSPKVDLATGLEATVDWFLSLERESLVSTTITV
ncbi:UDP-glucuronic acid decarboxylase 1 [Myotisia sp. PD_48]|nr:UDP-glucuronic acid decarboxylase 1 [Myotisia sp. PD_48]